MGQDLWTDSTILPWILPLTSLNPTQHHICKMNTPLATPTSPWLAAGPERNLEIISGRLRAYIMRKVHARSDRMLD